MSRTDESNAWLTVIVDDELRNVLASCVVRLGRVLGEDIERYSTAFRPREV